MSYINITSIITVCVVRKDVIFIYDDLNEIVALMLNVKRGDIERIDKSGSDMYVTLEKKELNLYKNYT